VKKLRAGGSGGRQSDSARSEAYRLLTEACVTAKQPDVQPIAITCISLLTHVKNVKKNADETESEPASER